MYNRQCMSCLYIYSFTPWTLLLKCLPIREGMGRSLRKLLVKSITFILKITTMILISHESLLIHSRRLSMIRESFGAKNLKSLKFDIPLMALTATATIGVREDILKSLCMSKETKIVTTSFFRPNLRFMVSEVFLTGVHWCTTFL